MFATAGAGGVVAGDPVDAGDDARERAAAGAVEHLDGDELDALGHAVGAAADRAGHVRAVPVAVGVVAVDGGVVPQTARPPKSVWVVRMPVSMMYAVTPRAVLG